MKIYGSFTDAIQHVQEDLCHRSYSIENDRWQSSDVKDKAGHTMQEILNCSFQVSVGVKSLVMHAKDIKPNLPWADDHFMERVGGVPLNPGVQWMRWPYANSAAEFLTEEKEKKFSHTYMERYWPKQAREAEGSYDIQSHRGIRYGYGDLSDVVNLLYREPETRQAFLPVWFPEDTGVVHGERVPCTLGYHFILRNDYLHMTYYIRSCDFTRHFRDDLYLSLRLQLWMLAKLKEMDMLKAPLGKLKWRGVQPGLFTFHCVSMHIFQNDYRKLCEDTTKPRS